MENLKGCLSCKHSKKGYLYLLCTQPDIAKRDYTYNTDTGKSKTHTAVVIAAHARCDSFGKCKLEAIYFEPTHYYKFKQWLKQLLK